MKKYAIVTDSTTYFTKDQFKEFGIKSASLNIIKGDETFKESEVDNAFVSKNLDDGFKLTTSQPSPGEYLDLYEGLIKEGYEKIFVMVISEELSGTYQSAKLAINMLDNPEKVHLFQSNMAAYGNEMLILKLKEMIDLDVPFDEIVSTIENLLKSTGLFFSIENLTAIMRSGRLSKAKAMVGTVLRVKPIIQMVDGKLDLYKAARTHKKVLAAMLQDMQKKVTDYKQLYVRICDFNSPEAAEDLKQSIMATFDNLKITVNSYIGPVFNIHLGKKGYGLSWMFE